MSYVDGYVLPLPKKNLKAYRRMASQAGKIWRKHGALDYKECVADDMKAGPMVPFPKAAKVKKGETVVFAFITYKSRSHRDRVNKRVMSDSKIHDICKEMEMPFDFKRMVYGGFKVIVDV